MMPAVFLDRDGILVEDCGPVALREHVRVFADAAPALTRLKGAGFALVAVSNQAVVARGMADERQVRSIQRHVEDELSRCGAPRLDAFYFCPHHPHADVPAYRRVCSCRKPQPGLLMRACADHGIDPSRSYMIGDRPSDILAGRRAGCRTVWAQTGRHLDPPIVGAAPDPVIADHRCRSLGEAATWILQEAV